MNKKIFKIMFYNSKKELLNIYASHVNTSSFLGLIEVSDIVFMDISEVLVNPEDEKIRKEFKNVERTFIPISCILRIDEVNMVKGTPVIRLYTTESGK